MYYKKLSNDTGLVIYDRKVSMIINNQCEGRWEYGPFYYTQKINFDENVFDDYIDIREDFNAFINFEKSFFSEHDELSYAIFNDKIYSLNYDKIKEVEINNIHTYVAWAIMFQCGSLSCLSLL